MTDEKIIHKRYDDLMSRFEDYSSTINELYMLKTDDEEEIQKLFEKIKTKLIETNIFTASQIINEISIIIQFRNRYLKSYFSLFKVLYDEYKPREEIPAIFVYLLSKDSNNLISTHCEKEFTQFEEEKVSFEVHEKGSVFRSIMDDDLQSLKTYMDNQGFETKIKLRSSLYPYTFNGISLIELSCYYGSLLFFNLLKTKYNMRVTNTCLSFSFLSGNQFIIDECLRHQTPNSETMRYAIISHNIEYVTSLFDEYGIMIDLSNCSKYKNIEALAAHYEITGDIQSCCYYSFGFCLQPLVQYFISLGADLQSTMNMFTDSNKQLNTRETSLPSTYSSNSSDNSKGTSIFETTKLISAVAKNNKDEVEFLVKHGEDPNSKDGFGLAALHYAVRKRSKDIVEILLSNDANIEIIDNYKNTPLFIAADNNYKDIVEVLVEHGADMNAKNSLGITLLISSISNNRNDIAKYLIEHGADVNMTSILGQSPLQRAFENQNIEIVVLLIKHGTKISEEEIKEIFQYAVKNKCQEIIKSIISQNSNKVSLDNSLDKFSLHDAVSKNDVEMVKFLISIGTNINETDDNGESPLCKAITNNNKEIVEILISNGAVLKTPLPNKNNCIRFAIENNMCEMIEFLISNCIKLEGNFPYNGNVLHFAIQKEMNEIAKILINHNFNINEVDLLGKTALHYSVENDMLDITELLLAHGADINSKDVDGNTALHNAVRENNYYKVKFLVSHDINVNATNNSGMTALHIAATTKQSQDIVDILINKDIDINASDKFGNTAIDYAYKQDLTEVINKLEYRGARTGNDRCICCIIIIFCFLLFLVIPAFFDNQK